MSLGEKRLFFLMSAGGLILLAVLAWLAWYLISPRLETLYPGLAGIIGVAALLASFVIAAGLLLVAVSALTGRRMLLGQRITSTVIRILFPPVLMLANIIGVDRDRVKRSFIAVNNALVEAARTEVRAQRVLLLLPHCLQVTDCPHKITGGLIENCRGCGRCVIAGLLALANEHDMSLVVATGGTLARRVIKEQKPEAIVAVACEMDLTSGIRDSYPLPVYGVLNERPNGPCRDTTVDLLAVRAAIAMLGENGEAVDDGGP